MKRTVNAIMLLVVLMCSINASAQSTQSKAGPYPPEVDVDGLRYRLTSDSTAALIRVTNNITDVSVYAGDIVVHDSIWAYDRLRAVTAIDGAFYHAEKLRSVTIPGSVEKITTYSFEKCANLQRMRLEPGKTQLTLPTIGLEALTTIEVGRGLNNSDMSLDKLEKIVVIARCSSLGGEYTYRRCKNVKEIIIEDSETTLEGGWRGIFPDDYTSGEKTPITLYLGRNVNPNGSNFLGNTPIKYVTIGPKVSYIEKHTFKGNGNIEEIVIPANVESIGYEAFMNCSLLKSLTLNEGLKLVDASAFYNCSNLKEVTIPASVEQLHDQAFCCYNLRSITILDSDSALMLSEGKYGRVFRNDSLEQVYIGRDFSEYDTPFYYLNNISNVSFGPNVTKIADQAFSSDKITEVTSLSVTPPAASENSFKNKVYQQAELSVPKRAVGDYQTAVMWKNFTHYTPITNRFTVSLNSVTAGGRVLLNGKESATIEVEEGDTLTIAPEADKGYKLKSLIVDGTDVTDRMADGAYTLPGIRADVSIDVNFREKTVYTLTTVYDRMMGRVSVNGETADTVLVAEDDEVVFSIVPNRYFRTEEVILNGGDVTGLLEDTVLRVASVAESMKLEVRFAELPVYSVSATCSGETDGGRVLINGKETDRLSLHEGETVTISIETAAVLLNGRDITADVHEGTFRIDSLTADARFEVRFKEHMVMLYLNDGAQGSIVQRLRYGTTFSFSLLPVDGWRVSSVLLNDRDVTGESENGWFTTPALTEDVWINIAYVNGEEGSAVESAEAQNVRVYGKRRRIEITGAEAGSTVEVYDTKGVRIYRGHDTGIDIENPAAYIVRVDRRTFKVLVN